MKVKNMIGVTLATAAAAAFMMAPVASFAADEMAPMAGAGVKCFGANACKGQSACKTAKNACKGQNGCKGQGMSMADSQKACTDMGGKLAE